MLNNIQTIAKPTAFQRPALGGAQSSWQGAGVYIAAKPKTPADERHVRALEELMGQISEPLAITFMKSSETGEVTDG